ncbi:MAG: ABC transporter substrate-binding protein [Anaerolineaceae bacterium]|jgi:peptide/nickel transport system substrate-binding protein
MKRIKLPLVVLTLSLLLAACGNDQPQLSPIPSQVTTDQTAISAPTQISTETPPSVLHVCMAEEPAGLYRYDGNESRAKQSVFSALYINLLEIDTETNQSLFFESIPSEENGGVLIHALPVKVGQPVVDATGKVVYLAEGTQIEPAANDSADSPITWNFDEEYLMNQFTVTFKLQPDLKWSDGEALVAEDFIFSYHLAEHSGSGHYQWALERTDSLVAADEQTLIWTGIPGFVPRNLEDILWQPLPSHQLSELSETELLTSDLTNRTPLGWGAYRLVSWDAGSQILLKKNPNFMLAGQGIPAYDQVIFHIEPNLDIALQKLENGQCDLLDKTYQLEGMEKSQLDSLIAQNGLIVEDWEPVQQLVFGIAPALYDDGTYNAWMSGRQDIFSNLDTRKTLAACIDADSLVNDYLAEHLPEALIPAVENQTSETIDPKVLLEEIGWVRISGSEGNLRIAQGVPNVLDGTPLSLYLMTGESQLDKRIAEAIIDRLGKCDVQVVNISLPLNELYRPGPDGPLFGRNFDLALISWQPENMNFCQLYTSDQIPSSMNSWVGTNIAGFSNGTFDEDCWQTSTRMSAYGTLDDAALMTEYLPAIPLMPHYRLWTASKRVNTPEDALFSDLWKFTPAQ